MTAGAGRAERVRFTAAERWTITVVGRLLRLAGAGPVLPLALGIDA